MQKMILSTSSVSHIKCFCIYIKYWFFYQIEELSMILIFMEKKMKGKPNMVVAMKFKGDSQITHNLRIYCQEHEILGQFHIVMDKVHKRETNQKGTQRKRMI